MPLIEDPHPRRLTGPRCRITAIIRGGRLPDDELAELKHYLTNEEAIDAVPARVLVEALAKRGIVTSAWSIQRHRRGECASCRSWMTS